VTDFKGNDPRFAYYFLSAIDFSRYNSGSAQPSLNRNYIYPIPISLPEPSEQKAIAQILGTLDDKIELTRRMNETLEAMAGALFKSWFVNFDPVYAKMDGRQPTRLAPVTADLFPDEFQDSPLGAIPQAWEVRAVGEVVDCVGGGTPSTKEPRFWNDGTHHWATPKDLSNLQAPILTHTERKITDDGLARISSGLLPKGTVLLSSRAPVGYLCITDMPLAVNQGFIAITPNARVSNYYVLSWCYENMSEIKSRAFGTTFSEISKASFRPISMLLPPRTVMEVFTDTVAPLYAQITSNLHQSRTLSILRDSLLPKLLSGEVSIGSASDLA
jgi:type I restriction enzyme, S subunit